MKEEDGFSQGAAGFVPIIGPNARHATFAQPEGLHAGWPIIPRSPLTPLGTIPVFNSRSLAGIPPRVVVLRRITYNPKCRWAVVRPFWSAAIHRRFVSGWQRPLCTVQVNDDAACPSPPSPESGDESPHSKKTPLVQELEKERHLWLTAWCSRPSCRRVPWLFSGYWRAARPRSLASRGSNNVWKGHGGWFRSNSPAKKLRGSKGRN